MRQPWGSDWIRPDVAEPAGSRVSLPVRVGSTGASGSTGAVGIVACVVKEIECSTESAETFACGVDAFENCSDALFSSFDSCLLKLTLGEGESFCTFEESFCTFEES